MRYLKNCWYQAGRSQELGFDSPLVRTMERGLNDMLRGIERLEVTAHRA